MRRTDEVGAAVGRRVWRRHPIATSVGAIAVLGAVVVGAGAIRAALHSENPVVPECRVAVGSSHYVIDTQQAANATTIAGVGKRLGMPDHAVTVALAAALQESKLYNLPYGDRDSLGLFQQRPSQGWGTPAELMDPRYAATAFFTALAHVTHWQAQLGDRRRAGGAAQRCTRGIRTVGTAGTNSREATTGEVPSALACQFALAPSRTPPNSPIPALTKDLGPFTADTSVSPARGWTIASWLVAHAEQYRISSVRFAGQRWTPHGNWSPVRSTQPGVGITQAPTRP